LKHHDRPLRIFFSAIHLISLQTLPMGQEFLSKPIVHRHSPDLAKGAKLHWIKIFRHKSSLHKSDISI